MITPSFLFFFESLHSSSQIDWNSDWYISRNTWTGSSLAQIHDTALQGSRLAAVCWVTHCRAATWKSLTATQPHRREKEAVYVSSASSHNSFFNLSMNSVWLAGRLSATLASEEKDVSSVGFPEVFQREKLNRPSARSHWNAQSTRSKQASLMEACGLCFW